MLPTITEIAKMANVSPATISLVMNNKPGVGADTRKRILKILREMGYSEEDGRAKKLNKNICIIKYKKDPKFTIDDNSVSTSIIEGICNKSVLLGCNIIMQNHNNTINAPIDGIIILGSELIEKDLILPELKIYPSVLVDCYSPKLNYDCVGVDNEYIALTVTEYLKSLGHKNIFHLKSNIPTFNYIERSKCFNNIDEYEVSPLYEESYIDILNLFKSGVKHDAFFADTDIIAVSTIKALNNIGITAGIDVSVIGCGNIPLCALTTPTISTFNIDYERLGELSVTRLIEKIENEDTSIQKLLYNADLIIRDSTIKI